MQALEVSIEGGPLSYRAALQQMIARLRAAGLEDPAVDARRLLSAAAGTTTLEIIADPDRVLEHGVAEQLESFLRRRLAREPVSRILGVRAFFGREFRVTPAVLDPRPETETVIEACLEIARTEGWHERPIRIVDVGTGTGCILVTLLAELPLAIGLGTDINARALETARGSADRLGVGGRATFALGSGLDGVSGQFDVLVSNPPYIPTDDIRDLAPEVREFDPSEALDGGCDGLAIYRQIANRLMQVVPRGWAVLEVGAGQAADVGRLLIEPGRPGVRAPRIWRDLGGHARCVAVQTQYCVTSK